MPISRALGRMVLQELAPRGLGVNALMRAVRARGYGYRAELLNADARLFSGRYKNEYWIGKLNVNEVVPTSIMNPTEMQAPYNYRAHFKTTYYDEATDSYLSFTESMYTNDLAKIEDWSEANKERSRERYEYEGISWTHSTLVAVDIDEYYLSTL